MDGRLAAEKTDAESMAKKSGFKPFVSAGIFLSMAALFLPSRTQGQSDPVAIHGIIRSSVGVLPVAEARITAYPTGENSQLEATSGPDGSFSLTNLRAGHYQLEASRAGFVHSRFVSVEVQPGQTLEVDLALGAAESSPSPNSEKKASGGFSADFSKRTRTTGKRCPPIAIRR